LLKLLFRLMLRFTINFISS